MTLSSTISSQANMLLRFLIARGTVWVSLGVWKKSPVYLHFKVEIGWNLQKDRAQPVYLIKEIKKRKKLPCELEGFSLSVDVRPGCTKTKDNTPIIKNITVIQKRFLKKVKMDTKLGKLSKNSKNQYSKVDVAWFNSTK